MPVGYYFSSKNFPPAANTGDIVAGAIIGALFAAVVVTVIVAAIVAVLCYTKKRKSKA